MKVGRWVIDGTAKKAVSYSEANTAPPPTSCGLPELSTGPTVPRCPKVHIASIAFDSMGHTGD